MFSCLHVYFIVRYSSYPFTSYHIYSSYHARPGKARGKATYFFIPFISLIVTAFYRLRILVLSPRFLYSTDRSNNIIATLQRSSDISITLQMLLQASLLYGLIYMVNNARTTKIHEHGLSVLFDKSVNSSSN